MGIIERIIALLFAHAIFDFALQSEWAGRNKSPQLNDIHINYKWILFAHSMVNGAGVAFVTGNVWLGVGETIWHFVTDSISVRRLIPFWVDQFSHGVSKVVWGCLWLGTTL